MGQTDGRSWQSCCAASILAMAQNVGPTRFADTPLKNLPGWIGQNLTSVTGIKRTLGVSFLNFQYNQRYKFPGPVAPLFVACATLGAMLQHEFHEGMFLRKMLRCGQAAALGS